MDLKKILKQMWNLPNMLSIFRLLLVPVYVVLFVKGKKYWALLCFLVASFTDLLDGRIARKYNLITDFGKLVDPLADKVMVLTAMFSMTIGNQSIPPVIPQAASFILLAKELVMMAGGFIMLKKKIVVYSTLIGKAAQCLFVASLVMVHFHDWFAARCVGWFLTPDLIMLWLSVCLTLCALAKYVIWSVRTAKEKGVI